MCFLAEMLTEIGGRQVNEDRFNFLEINETPIGSSLLA